MTSTTLLQNSKNVGVEKVWHIVIQPEDNPNISQAHFVLLDVVNKSFKY